MAIHIVDRRLNPGSKSSGESPALSASGQGAGSGGGEEIVAGPGHQGCPGRRRGQRPDRWHGRAALSPRGRHARHGAAWKQEVHRRRYAAAAEPERRQGQGRGRGRQRRCVPLRSQPRRVCRPVPGRSGIARSRQAKAGRGRKPGHSPGGLHDLRLARQYFGEPNGQSRPGAARRAAAAEAGGAGGPRGGAWRIAATRRAAPS